MPAISLVVMLICGAKLLALRQEYRAGEQSYKELATLARHAGVAPAALTATQNEEPPHSTVPATFDPAVSIDFATLCAVNPC
ncbi:MAG: hypothetical protein FWG61_03145 [Firmicutes bacterium]|nr:hypothetical protein [Bacillota bacterium]